MQRVDFPEPRGIANANSSPRRTAPSILPIAVRWSADHASGNDSAPYVSQNARKSARQASRRFASTTGGSSPMSRAVAVIDRERFPASDFAFS